MGKGKKILAYLLVSLVFLLISNGAVLSGCSDTMSLGSGEQFVFTLSPRREVFNVTHYIIMVTNGSSPYNMSETVSFNGNMVGRGTYDGSPEIENLTVTNSTVGGVTSFNISGEIHPSPFKIASIELHYQAKGNLRNLGGDGWSFRYDFTSTGGSHEIVVRIEKPDIFHSISFEELVPVPNFFLNEDKYYTLTWPFPLFISVGTTLTSVFVHFTEYWDWAKFGVIVVPMVIGLLGGILIEKLFRYPRER